MLNLSRATVRADRVSCFERVQYEGTITMASHDRRIAAMSDNGTTLMQNTAELGSGDAYIAGLKRVLDVTLSAIVMIPASVLIGLFAALVALDGRNPFYRQERIGRNGKTFFMWKLRSMVPGADKVLDTYLDSNNDARKEWDRTQKLKNDPRITPIGRFIRKTSIDELPQLFNVLNGEMSLVGPRPMMVNQRALYPGIAYYALRPGITGFWQTSSRNESSFAERATFDASYFREISLMTDLRVLFKTVSVVVKGTGY